MRVVRLVQLMGTRINTYLIPSLSEGKKQPHQTASPSQEIRGSDGSTV